MLTSKSDVETRIESLEVGADQYLSKPFLMPELELQIRNILAAKSNLKKHFIQFGNVKVDHPIKNRDQQFIERISAIVLDNIDNPELNVSVITKEVGIGRTLLHTKLKQILDLSATEFINTIRLKEAQKILINEPDTTMSEVAYKVGFNDPNYFSRIFKKMFNVSPTAYRTHQTNDEQE
jgi:AraC-like DNA-binding protein